MRSRWIWAALFCLVAAGLSTGGFLYYRFDADQIRQDKFQDLAAITSLKIQQILTWREDILTDAGRLADDRLFIETLQSWLNDPDDQAAHAYLTERLALTNADETNYASIVIADTTGKIHLSTGLADIHFDPDLERQINESISTGEINFGDLHLCSICDKIDMHVVAPLASPNARPFAVLIFRIDPNDQLFPLVQTWPTPSKSAENLMVRREGDFAVFLNYVHFYEDAPLNLRMPITETDVPAVKAVLGFTGSFEGLDYRGVPVLADIRPVPGTPWYIIGKVDTAEILSEVNYRAWVVALFVIGSILLMAVLMISVFSMRQQGIYRSLYREEQEKREAVELFRTTLYSIGDGVITTDARGQVNQLNPTAEALTGWQEADARGHDLTEVFNIVNAQTGQPADNPVQKVLQFGQIVGLANHTKLISRDGSEFQIADSGAPIHDEDGRVNGVVMVFRDVTEDYRLKENLEISEERYRLLFDNMPQGFALHEIILDDTGTPVDYRFLQINRAFEQLTGLRADNVVGKTVLEILPGTESFWIETYATVALQGTVAEFENYSQPIDRHFHVRAFSPKRGQFAVIFTDITGRKKAERDAANRTSEIEALYSLSARLREALTAESILPLVVAEMNRSIPCEGASILMVEVVQDGFLITAGSGALAFIQGSHIAFNAVNSTAGEMGLDLAGLTRSLQAITTAPAGCQMALSEIRSETQLLGLLVITRQSQIPFSEEERRLLVAMGEITASALRRAGLFEQAQIHLRRTQALHIIDLAITSSLDLRTAMEIFLEQTFIHLDADAVAVLLLKPHGMTLDYFAGRGFHTRMIETSSLHLSDSQAGQAVIQRKTVSLPDLDNGPQNFARSRMVLSEGFRAYHAAPLIAKGQVQGVVEVFHRAPVHPSHDWLGFLDILASQAAIAVDSLSTFDKLQRTRDRLEMAYDDTIAGWSHAMDLRDRATEKHAQRVTDLSIKLAIRMGLHGDEIINIRRGALLHDVGKLAIPDSILLKPGTLTPEEWELMRQHPQYAFDWLSRIEILRPAMDIPYCHHEKWNGSGYPRGLSGDKIPLAARIFAVVDVYDALTSHRPYGEPWPDDKVLEYIRSQSGSHFDPRVADAFLAMMSTSAPTNRVAQLPR